MYTTSSALLEALTEAGVSYIFANFGSDHPALIEAIAAARAEGQPTPAVVTCPTEMVALACAHGFAQLTGRAQAVVVHVDCGTQSLGGAVHNAAKGRVPVFIFAGLSPVTQAGELRGSRNEFIHWIQDVRDQRGILRQYMKYDTELRVAANVKSLVHRALQFAHSDPKGPVYMVGAREVMEAPGTPCSIDLRQWQPLRPAALAPADAHSIVAALATATRPLVLTSYLGRAPAAVPELLQLCRTLAIGVLESVPNCLNYPHTDPLYLGSQWNEPRQNPVLEAADVILVIDSDVPWIPTVNQPDRNARIFHIDVDALKNSMPLWYIGAQHSFQADATTALQQLNVLAAGAKLDQTLIEERRAHYSTLHAARAARLRQAEQPGETLSAAFFTAALREQLGDASIVLNEGISHYGIICDHMRREQPGAFFNSGGGSLGWNGGAAIGAKLARPEMTVVALSGDGSYMFSEPAAVHWMARRFRAPFLQVIYNNRGWRAPKDSTLAVHPTGYASRSAFSELVFDPPPDYAAIAAAAGGAYARQVRDNADVVPAITEALRVVREEQRAAVLDVWLPRL